MQFLSFVAWEPRDKARALPQLDGLPVGEPGGLADRLPIVNALVGGAATRPSVVVPSVVVMEIRYAGHRQLPRFEAGARSRLSVTDAERMP
jgi:hypothetical protein